MFQNPKRSLGLVDVDIYIYRDDLRVRKWTTRLVLGMCDLSLLKSLTQQMLTYKVKTAAIQETICTGGEEIWATKSHTGFSSEKMRVAERVV